jgi:hypothetical protein
MRLVSFLISKAILEALFVAALVVGFYVTAFHTNLRGWSERSEGRIVGQVVDTSVPSAFVGVQLYVDDRFIKDGLANVQRLVASEQNHALDASHYFQFNIPPLDAGEHVAEVYAVRESSGGGARRVLQLIGKPVRFTVGESSKTANAVR